MRTKKEIQQIEKNINLILDMYFEATKKGNDEKAFQAVDRLTYELKKLRGEQPEELNLLH